MRPTPTPVSTAGFTLIEVTVVLVILGMALALLASRGPLHSAALDLRAATASVTQALRLSRAQAIRDDRMVDFSFDPARHAMRVGTDAPTALPASVALSITTSPDQPALIRFGPDGSASGGRIDLATGALRSSIAVNWLTGRISVDQADAR